VACRAFVDVPILKSGTPVHVSLTAGSRRVPHRPSSPPVPALLPSMLRQLCFLAILKDSCASLVATLDSPGLSASSASPMINVDGSPGAVSGRNLSFTPKDNKEMTYRMEHLRSGGCPTGGKWQECS
jgi:hypothetical protein